jgi:hypothetical protein
VRQHARELALGALRLQEAQEGLAAALERGGIRLDDRELDAFPWESTLATLSPDRIVHAALQEDGGEVELRYRLRADAMIVDAARWE